MTDASRASWTVESRNLVSCSLRVAVGPRGDQAPVGDDDGVSPIFKSPEETERINSFRDEL